MDDVIFYMRQELLEESSREDFAVHQPDHQSLKCPLHRSGVLVELFIAKQEYAGKVYESIAGAGNSEFILVPEEEMIVYDKLCQEMNRAELVLLCPPFIHWATVVQGPMSMQYVCQKVYKISSNANSEYQRWYETLKSSLESSDSFL